MNVTYLTPANQVSAYVQGILVVENNHMANPFYLPLIANGTPTLLFQTSRAQIKNNSNHLTLFGQTILPEKLLIKEDFTLIAYFFKPYSLTSLFGLSAHELTDHPVDFNLLSKSSGLQEKLLNAGTIRQMISFIDSYIFSLIEKNKANDKLIQYVTKRISDAPFKNILSKIQKDVCVTERTFQRIFEKEIGISPNQFRKISQFDKAFQILNNKQFKSLSDIAFESGYADQSHYIRVFKEFTTLTPKEYLNLSMVT